MGVQHLNAGISQAGGMHPSAPTPHTSRSGETIGALGNGGAAGPRTGSQPIVGKPMPGVLGVNHPMPPAGTRGGYKYGNTHPPIGNGVAVPTRFESGGTAGGA